jgi:KTSC domain
MTSIQAISSRLRTKKNMRNLFVTFKSTHLYRYEGVSAEVVNAFVAAPSKGKYFSANIRRGYPMRRVGAGGDRATEAPYPRCTTRRKRRLVDTKHLSTKHRNTQHFLPIPPQLSISRNQQRPRCAMPCFNRCREFRVPLANFHRAPRSSVPCQDRSEHR